MNSITIFKRALPSIGLVVLYSVFLILRPENSRTDFILFAVFTALAVLHCSVVLIRLFIHESALRKITVIPEFKLSEVTFSELSMLLDGNISKRDTLAILCYYALNHAQEDDKIALQIKKVLSPHTISILYRTYFLGQETEEESNANIALSLHKKIKKPILRKLQAKQYFRYNPNTVRTVGGMFALLSFAVLAFLGFFLENLPKVEAIGVLMHIVLFVSLVSISSAAVFFERLTQIVPIQQKARGFYLYLKTVEWYRVESNEKTFRDCIPYFILFNVKKQHFEEMILKTQEVMQIGGKDSQTLF